MSAEKFGIKETKEVVVFVVALVQGVADSLADGKLNIFDLFKFFKALRLLGPAVKDFTKIKDEIMDLSDVEKVELCDAIAKEFNMENKVVEGFIEQALQAIVYMIDLLPFAEEVKKAVV